MTPLRPTFYHRPVARGCEPPQTVGPRLALVRARSVGHSRAVITLLSGSAVGTEKGEIETGHRGAGEPDARQGRVTPDRGEAPL